MYNLNEKVYIQENDSIIECKITGIRWEAGKQEFIVSYDLEDDYGTYRRLETEVFKTKGEAMDAYGYEFTIWAMCPYCENEVELCTIKETECPRCGAHFRPSEEEIEESLLYQDA